MEISREVTEVEIEQFRSIFPSYWMNPVNQLELDHWTIFYTMVTLVNTFVPDVPVNDCQTLSSVSKKHKLSRPFFIAKPV